METIYTHFSLRQSFIQLMFLMLVSFGSAQQRPQYTQYIVNNYLLNPAISGIENYIDVKAGHRSQWTGLDGAPVTNFFSIHAPLAKSDLSGTATSFGGQEDNPMSRSYLQTYMASEPHHGIGLHGVVDKAGPISRLDLNATYAYHIGLSPRLNLAVGVAAGVSKLDLDISKITLEESADRAIPDNLNQQFKPDLGAGIWLYGARYFVGFSGQQLLGQPLTFANESAALDHNGKNVRHYFLTAGYKVFLGEDIAAIPSVMIKRVSPVPNSYDTNVKIAFRDRFWLGGSYRHKDSFSALAGLYISNFFNLSYSFDYTLSELTKVNKGSHEVVIGFLLNNTYRVTCPQKNW